MSQFAPRPGCPMCSIATSAQMSAIPPSPLPTSSFLSSSHSGQDILWRDDNFTAYHEKTNPVSSKGHIIILFNLHVPSIYSLSTTDLPLLIAMQRIAQRLLNQIAAPAGPPSPGVAGAPTPGITPLTPDYSNFKIGFIVYPFKDTKIPVTDHLHAHCYVGTPDLAGWWRGMAYGPLSWYSIDDLIAEIRETSTNNRVKVKIGHELRPIDTVPSAGARTGLPDGRELTVPSIGVLDPEEGITLTTPTPPARRRSTETEPIARPSSVTPLTAPEPDPEPSHSPSDVDITASATTTTIE